MQTTTIDELIEKSDIYIKTSINLYKYETIYKLADIFSNLAVKFVITIVVVLFLLLLSIGLSLCIGYYLDSSFLGFVIVAFGYLSLAILFYIFREKWIKIPVSNFIISKMKNKTI
ncbi:MAG: hypothetical protein QM535_12645 [Limnohabitans sp.]|nr:hypothetical protein [Limnohabitans sp.]